MQKGRRALQTFVFIVLIKSYNKVIHHRSWKLNEYTDRFESIFIINTTSIVGHEKKITKKLKSKKEEKIEYVSVILKIPS